MIAGSMQDWADMERQGMPDRQMVLIAKAELRDIYRKFGPPGDHGYDTEMGKLLVAVGDLHNRLAEHIAKGAVPA